MTRRVKLRPDAPHIPPEHRGEEAEVVERKPLAFGQTWLRLQFADGCELWTTEERVQDVEAGCRPDPGGADGNPGSLEKIAPAGVEESPRGPAPSRFIHPTPGARRE